MCIVFKYNNVMKDDVMPDNVCKIVDDGFDVFSVECDLSDYDKKTFRYVIDQVTDGLYDHLGYYPRDVWWEFDEGDQTVSLVCAGIHPPPVNEMEIFIQSSISKKDSDTEWEKSYYDEWGYKDE